MTSSSVQSEKLAGYKCIRFVKECAARGISFESADELVAAVETVGLLKRAYSMPDIERQRLEEQYKEEQRGYLARRDNKLNDLLIARGLMGATIGGAISGVDSYMSDNSAKDIALDTLLGAGIWGTLGAGSQAIYNQIIKDKG